MKRAQRLLLAWYARERRSYLPWRQTRDPYRILISEVMLAQTQVERVIPKYLRFIERFPTVAALAEASTADVLRYWQGLGYNSRAVRLKELAGAVLERYGGTIPRDEHALRSLPGVGPYTVAAVRAFAFDADDAAVDTNVRRVVHRLLYGMEFPAAKTERELHADARAFVPADAGHDWNSAMMDLGASICTARAPKCLICPMRNVCAAAPVEARALEVARKTWSGRNAVRPMPFEQTARYARGRVVERLRALPAGQRISLMELERDLCGQLEKTRWTLGTIVDALSRDGLVEVQDRRIGLKE